ncbi:helix-turn-helix transcriptional regulator [Streptomyces ipomoeae]|uniref:Toxin-antitoxin system, antitoxin component, Xre family n=1 Tax=Streptomyces ipomoeae 91-03 TaxID=698759 RepID=L1KLM1_9ACTN|nr:helix-turn-helix transcriptional regulator [Streptomyces ipomoeae]EKX61370.1 toxin-antitoxin system, antitoxin component, Xre family [Streptomyces ipomoeae 91-03]MDX2700767.1 helix-turn-helix transcriptional regulator [Streptomyces ipomoeae]MDX2828460.1 helix-turn-helix transcriptional regulator [Streptomyces ipomoeae]MDX2845951.1 helix-turn-helix transcriptional regulator [Streptomyces ipomoeae]MDX2880140.1 helix-turn-helix transcriptional regulator [Streptomyces ipomoeae]
MPPRMQPTVRQVRLGTELRRLRETAGLTSREAAGLLGINPAQMSQFEAGNVGISEARVRRLMAHYACPDSELVEALVEMATDRTRGWWERYRGVLPPVFLDLAELEHHATFIEEIATAHIPGLLQTEEYARAVFAYWRPELPESELVPRVEHRMSRKVVLERCPYEVVLHEPVLRTRVADRRVARAQLDALLARSQAPGVTVRVVPFDVDGFAGASAELLYVGGRVPTLDTAQRDSPQGPAFIDAAAQLQSMRTLFRKVQGASLDPVRSRDFIHRLAKEL